MKSIGKYFGLIGFILFFVATIFKIFHLQGASMLLLLGVLSSIVYFVSSFFIKEISALKGLDKINTIVLPIAMIIFLLSFLFKMMHWQGAGHLINVSLIAFCILVITTLISLFSKQKTHIGEFVDLYKFSFLYVIVVLILMGVRSII